MANQIYGYSSSYGGSGGGYSMRASDPYLSAAGSSRYAAEADAAAKYAALDFGGDRVSSLYSSQRLASVDVAGKIGGGIGSAAPSLYSQSSWGGVDVDSGMKRSAEALYHHTILGSHNTTGQSEALFSTNSLVKRPRIDIASNLPVYPQRPGEKDCAHYMVTRTCRFGEACKFDHPIWVPEGGIPDWKEVPLMPISESLPERPGEADCPYFLKTQKCKFGFRCKFNHPKDTLTSSAGGSNGEGVEPASHAVLPDRPSEPICAFYAKTGKCKFGANCKFHHPKDIEIPSAGQDGGVEPADSTVKDNGAASGESVTAKSFVPFTPALLHNSKGLPIRPGETDCPFYLKTGSCKYGATCRYNHPDRNAINPTFIANLGHAIAPSPASSLQVGVVNPAASLFQSLDPLLAQTTLGVSPTVYPQRPGQIECDFYMKTGQCKFGERCKFHHPIDRLAPTLSAAKQAQVGVKLTLAGLPRREGSVACPFYMKTGTCKYGATCRFDHPPPGEAIAMATVQGTVNANAAGEAEKDVAATGENQQ